MNFSHKDNNSVVTLVEIKLSELSWSLSEAQFEIISSISTLANCTWLSGLSVLIGVIQQI